MGMIRPLLAAVVLALAVAPAWAADPPTPPHAQTDPKVHPEKDQDAATQQADETACRSSAVAASGFDPATAAPVEKAEPAPVAGSGARVRGAAAGATVAAIGDNDTSDGAAKGAVAGGMAQRRRNRAAAAQQNQSAQQQRAAQQASFDAARKACLGERGYRVDP
jgi:hypothetical protein